MTKQEFEAQMDDYNNWLAEEEDPVVWREVLHNLMKLCRLWNRRFACG